MLSLLVVCGNERSVVCIPAQNDWSTSAQSIGHMAAIEGCCCATNSVDYLQGVERKVARFGRDHVINAAT